MNLNNNKIRIVDGTMGLGITPTSRLHVFGNGTTSNLLNLVNDKDATKDSSVVVTSNGSFCSGTNTPYSLTKNTFMLYDNANTGIFNTTWVDSTTVDSNKLHLNRIQSFNTTNGVYGDFGIGGATYGTNADIRNSFYISSYSGSFHLCNEYYVKATIATNGVGIGMISPNAALDVRDRWGASYVFKAGNDLDATLDSSIVSTVEGKVGIGQGTPLYRLDIGTGGTDAIRNEILRINSADNNELSNSIILLARGDTTRTTIATSSTNNLFITGSKENDLCIKTESNNILFSANDDDELDIKIDTNGNLNIYEEIIWRDSVGDYIKGTTLSDNEAFALPTGYSWKGEIDVDSLGVTLFTAQLRCDADGTPYLEGVSWKRWSSITYVEVGSTDGYLNITDGGSGMVITNTLGYTIKATLRFRTKQ
jgi:hypothetical protein